MSKLPYINLGCGTHFYQNWHNLDFVAMAEGVQAHNLLKGIPYPDFTFEAVYHSHVLEHFTKQDGEKLLAECYRILKPQGIIRVVVPDLEQIVRQYLHWLEKGIKDLTDQSSAQNYDWIMLEMYDQCVRNVSGGEMAKYLFQDHIPNRDFVMSRIGWEGETLIANFLKNKKHETSTEKTIWQKIGYYFSWYPYKNRLKRWLFSEQLETFAEEQRLLEIARFRASGQIHAWMYDRYSLERLLTKLGFQNVQIFSAFESQIPNWKTFGLDFIGEQVRKPESLFIEATKP